MIPRVLICCWLLASLSAAQAIGESLTIRGRGVWTDESDDLGRSNTFGIVSTTVTIDGADGLALAAEWRLVPFWGLELSVTELAFDAEFRQSEFRPPGLPQVPEIFDQGELVVRPVSLALLMHPLRRARSDLYFGPAVSRVSYDVDVGSELERDDEWGYGVVLGLEVPIGEAGWAAGLEGRYLTEGSTTTRSTACGGGSAPTGSPPASRIVSVGGSAARERRCYDSMAHVEA